MSSVETIAKLALHHLSDRFDLETLTDPTPEAEAINLVYDTTRDALLREHPWKFAKAYRCPTAIATGTPPANWDYMFVYFDDAVKIITIISPMGRKVLPAKFDIARNAEGIKVILTDVESPEFQFTQRIVDPYEFDALFTQAFAYRLAADVCLTLTGDRGLMKEMNALADEKVGQAQSDDANEGVGEEQDRDPDWITARA